MFRRFTKSTQVALTVVFAILAALLTAQAPAQAADYRGLTLWYDTMAPGSRIVVSNNSWFPQTATFEWYRCDSPVEGVEVTTTPIPIPSDCSLIPGVTDNYYDISPLSVGNPDEGKFLAALMIGDGTEYSLSMSFQNFVILNRNGGNNSTDGMRIVYGNGSVQIYRNGINQIYGFGSNGPGSSIPALGAEGVVIAPPNFTTPDGVGQGWNSQGGTTLVPWDTSDTELVTDDDNGLFEAKTTFTKTFANGNTYSMVETLTYRAPNQVADVSFDVEVPVGATTPVSLYYGLDMYLDGNDFGPGRTLKFGGKRLVVQTNNSAVGGILEGNGPGFTSWVEAFYSCIFGFENTRDPESTCGPYGVVKYALGTPEYPNTVDTSNSDSGVGAQWTLGTSPGTYSRDLKLYFSAKTVGVNLTYSQAEARPNSQVVTYVSLSNPAGSQVDNAAFDIALPPATYAAPVSGCGGTATIDRSSGTPHLIVTGGTMTPQVGSCQIILPTTFTTAGVREVNSADLVSGIFYRDFDVENASSISNMLSASIDIKADGPEAPSVSVAATSTAASAVQQTSAQLTGTGSVAGLPGFATFCYSTNANLSNCTEVSAVQTLDEGASNASLTANITGLAPGTRYYYRITVSNGLTSQQGTIMSFTTSNCYQVLTGGNIASGEHAVMFTGTCQWSVPAGVTEVKALVVAGGGGGGADCVGGGGGAGGVVYNEHLAVSATVSVTVGQGGSAGHFQGNCQGTQAGNGGNSSFGTITALGGGGGGNFNSFLDGATGGSGGGGGGVSGHGGAGTAGQGFAGGDGVAGPGNPGGGGGGATAAGGLPTATGDGGAGGAGFTSSIGGVDETYAAGGGGGSDATGGAGGAACAGTGASGETPATDATGFGCGGGGGDGHNAGGVGSSGVVIIRWTDPVVQPPVISTAQRSVSGFKFEKFVLSSEAKKAIRAFVMAHPSLTKVSCTGYTGFNWNKRSTVFLKTIALKRAAQVCAYAKSVKPTLVIVKKSFGKSSSKNELARRVLIKLTN